MRDPIRDERRSKLPQVFQLDGRTFEIQNGKIPLREMLRSSDHYRSLIEKYRQRVLTQKTRTIRLLGVKHPAKILNTLLGYEVQAAYKRIQCPDLVTARYVRLFSELGCHSIQLPYDPTLTAELIPEFEAILEAFVRQLRAIFAQDTSLQQYVIRKVFAHIRKELRSA